MTMNFYVKLVSFFLFFISALIAQDLKVAFGIGKPPYVFHENKNGILFSLKRNRCPTEGVKRSIRFEKKSKYFMTSESSGSVPFIAKS